MINEHNVKHLITSLDKNYGHKHKPILLHISLLLIFYIQGGSKIKNP